MEIIKSLLAIKAKEGRSQKLSSNSQKLNDFEDLISQNPNISDDEACFQIYKLKNKTAGYKSLKYRLEEKLLNDLFIMSIDSFDHGSRINSRPIVCRYYTVALILLKHGNRAVAVYYLEKALRLSCKYSLLGLSLIILRILINHFSFVEVNKKKMKEYEALKASQLEIFNAEEFVVQCNAKISHYYMLSNGLLSKPQLSEVKEMVRKMNEIASKYESDEINSYTRDLTFFYYSFIGDYKKCLEISKANLDYLLSSANPEPLILFQCKRNLAISYFYNKLFNQASELYIQINQMITVGSRNWFIINGFYFSTLIYSKAYSDVYHLTVKVLGHKNLKDNQAHAEQWNIREAYIQFLIRIGKIEEPAVEKEKLKKFTISKFVNSVPFYSRDKSGQNITIIILQILFLLLDKKFGKIIDYVDALTQYQYRYVRKDDSYRSNLFIKMILLSIKADFHPVRSQNFTADLRKKLLKSNMVTDERSAQLEIIPYDVLWEFYLQLLAIVNK